MGFSLTAGVIPDGTNGSVCGRNEFLQPQAEQALNRLLMLRGR
jgi:hypothetical protein